MTRTEQLRAAKRAQRQRERKAGLATVELRLSADDAERLRVAMNGRGFALAFRRFLHDEVLDTKEWPALRALAWNRTDRWIPAEEALAVYERNWRFVEPARLGRDEAALIEQLKARFGKGVFNA